MKKKVRSERIEEIKKKHRHEWLLIAVHKMDEATTTPISGRLIAHSPHRHEIYSALKNSRLPNRVLVEYAEDDLPKGYAAAFLVSHGKIST